MKVLCNPLVPQRQWYANAYGLAAGASHAPDDVFANRIVSYQAPESLVALLGVLDAVVTALRNADWPDWDALGDS